jgi:SH3-like domain-containing protein
MYLKYGLYVNKTHDEKSTRVWFFGPGLEVEVIEHHKDWVKIKARDGKQGFVKKDVLTSDKP